MCGIVGALMRDNSNCVPLLLEGLGRLEYRGYDSCGLAVLQQTKLKRLRSTERVAYLAKQVSEHGLQGSVGIAHTRWATHGAPTTYNAHPHFSVSSTLQVGIVHNGIIENYQDLRALLEKQGYVFRSQTDTEAVAHLIHWLYEGDILTAVQQACRRLRGAYSLAVLCAQEPERFIGACNGSPLVFAMSAQGYFVASDALAVAGQAEQLIYLSDGDMIDVQQSFYAITNSFGQPQHRDKQPMPQAVVEAKLGPYQHYMQKEIFEQPRAIANTLQDIDTVTSELFGQQAQQVLPKVKQVLILACGTSFYAGMTARYWLEDIAGLPTTVEMASEYRYRRSVPNADTLVVAISQSGETADTLAALKHAQALGMQHHLAICNVATSTLVRACNMHFITRAGVEIGVASTKAFTTQLVALFLLCLTLAKVRGLLGAEQLKQYLKQLRHLPTAMASVLALEPQIISWAQFFTHKEHALFLGRGLHYPIALEGALKLMEVSYIHAQGYPAGELKHGPLALVTKTMPVVVVAPDDELLDKLKANMEEVQARGGALYVFADADSKIQNHQQIRVIQMPKHYGLLSPILHVLPLQLLAYHTALNRGTDVDKPRNLAKSVTVE